MAKGKKRTSRPKKKIKKPNSIVSFFKSQQTHLVFGVLVFSSAIFLLISFYSFLQHWKEDQSILNSFSDKTFSADNLLGKLGANLSDFFVYDGFGVATFIIPILLFFTGLYIILHIPVKQLYKSWINGLITMIWISLGLAYLRPEIPLLGGKVGFEMNEFLQIYFGGIGVLLLLMISFFVFIIASFKITPAKIKAWMPKPKLKLNKDSALADDDFEESFEIESDQDMLDEGIELELDTFETLEPEKELEEAVILEPEVTLNAIEDKHEAPEKVLEDKNEGEIKIEVKGPVQEAHIGKNLSNSALKDFGEFDPRLELSKFKFPELNLLKDYSNENIHINKQELENNKNRIVETLNNYKIGIASIKATIGPTVTLYEIVPEAGVRISKIKNLEDDIALSLSALGIRIIAPIPGRGTIGIEVPNKKPSIVSMKSVLSSQKFQNTKMDLPIALGKTISNETFVIDLAKMPHLLMAGATGQGKSVGLNAVLASLLYKKHPAEVKFVLVDPKKVELTLFNKIERHYLAKLPDTEEAIITGAT